jgi:uncharacterized protein YbjT (DUF2867 family)
MRVAITGGTGTLGKSVAEVLRARGHEVRVLSRHAPEHRVDLTTGEGLAEALTGCDAVVDASNPTTVSAKAATAVLVDGGRRLLAAEQAAGVGHHVCVSIVGCANVPVGYYRVKIEQENLVKGGPVPWTIVRATQFHDLVAQWFGALAKWRIMPMPSVPVQTVSVDEVAQAVADELERGARRGYVEVAGPEIVDMRDLSRTWMRATGRRALSVPLPLPGKLGRALRARGLTASEPDVRGELTFAAWLDGAR